MYRDDRRSLDRRQPGIRRSRFGLPVILLAAPLWGCTGVMDPAGPVGVQQRSILFNSLAVMLCIVLPTIAATLAFAWWFRAGNERAHRRPDFVYSGRVELVTWSIPVLVILFLGGIAWIGSHDLDPAKPIPSRAEPVDVQVVALDWKWLFIYPKYGVASVNRLTMPVGTPVRFRITSASVMNAFFVPQLGSMIYAMNGMATQLNLQADRQGIYAGLSTHFSGDGFADMRFTVEAMPPAGFEAWAAEAMKSGPVLNEESYVALTEQSTDVSPFLYRAVQPGLFDAVVNQTIPPGPGPRKGKPGPEVMPRTEN